MARIETITGPVPFERIKGPIARTKVEPQPAIPDSRVIFPGAPNPSVGTEIQAVPAQDQFVSDELNRFKEMSLIERLNSIAETNPGEFGEDSVIRVKRVIDHKLRFPERKTQFKWMRSITDYRLYHRLHPEWQGKTRQEMREDISSGGQAFARSFESFVRRTVPGREEAAQIIHQLLPRQKYDWSGFRTFSDWESVYRQHPEWEEKTAVEFVADHATGAGAFYSAFKKWADKETKDKKERRKIISRLIPKKEKKWERFKTIEDWQGEYVKHPEWYGKSRVEMTHYKENGGNAFHAAFMRWVNENSSTKEERKSLTYKVFPKLPISRQTRKPKEVKKPTVRSYDNVLWGIPGNTDEENEQIAVRTIQRRFLSAFPEFDRLYPKGEDGKIDQEKREEAKNFIMDRTGHNKKFLEVIGKGAQVRTAAPYFHGSYIFAIAKSFSPWGLDFGVFADPAEAARWRALGYFSKKYRISYSVLAPLFDGVPAINRIDARNKDLALYDEAEAVRRILSLPQVDVGTGKYLDEWIPATVFARAEGVDPRTLNLRINDLPSIVGRAINGHIVPLYRESELRKALDDILALPRIGDEDEFMGADGRLWVSARYVVDNYSVSKGYQRKLSEIPSIQVSGSRRITSFYDKSKLLIAFGDFFSLPRVDKNSGVYTHESGNWATLGELAHQAGTDWNSFVHHMDGVRFIEGRDKSGRRTKLYNQEEAIRAYTLRTRRSKTAESSPISPEEANRALAEFLGVEG